MHRPDRFVARAIADAHAVQPDFGDIAFFKIDDPPGDLEQRRRVRRREILALAQSQQKRRPFARDDQAFGIAFGQDRDRVGAAQFRDGFAHGGGQVAVLLPVLVDQVSDDFRIGVGSELISGGRKPRADFLVILDDAVMHDREAVLADVRVGIAFGRNAVGGPARVRNAQVAVNLGSIGHLCQRRDTSDAAQAVEAAIDYCNAGGIVAAIFELAQAFEQDGNDVTPRDCAYDSAHKVGDW